LVPTATSAFHVYSIDWTDGRIVMAVDGKPCATYDRKPGDTMAELPFDEPPARAGRTIVSFQPAAAAAKITRQARGYD